MNYMEFLSQPFIIFLIGVVIYEIRQLRQEIKGCVNLKDCERKMAEQKKDIEALEKQVQKNTVAINVLEVKK